MSVFAYYWIKSYLLKAFALFLLVKAWILAPFTWANKLWLNLTDLAWMTAPFAWAWDRSKTGVLWVWSLTQNIKIGKPRLLEWEMWRLEWFKRPEWLSWPHWGVSIPEVVKDGFEVFVPDGVQAAEEVLEEL